MTNEFARGDADGQEAADILDSAAAAPRRSRARVLSAVAIVGTAAVVAAALLVSRYLNRPLSPAAFVTQSAQRTLAEHTAGVTLSGTLSVGNQQVPLHGTGEADFATGAMDLTMSMSASRSTVTEQEIQVGGALYVAVSIDGRSIAQVDGGRPWIRMPVQQTATAHLDGSNPSSALSVLEQNGNKVRALGTSVIGGVTCTGYAVTTSKAAVIAGARRVIPYGFSGRIR